MNVKKIFITLITVVACVILGAFVLNTLMPNVTTTLINAVEDQIFKATSLKFDFNNDGTIGSNNNNPYAGENEDETVTGDTGNNVVGFSGAGGAGGGAGG